MGDLRDPDSGAPSGGSRMGRVGLAGPLARHEAAHPRSPPDPRHLLPGRFRPLPGCRCAVVGGPRGPLGATERRGCRVGSGEGPSPVAEGSEAGRSLGATDGGSRKDRGEAVRGGMGLPRPRRGKPSRLDTERAPGSSGRGSSHRKSCGSLAGKRMGGRPARGRGGHLGRSLERRYWSAGPLRELEPKGRIRRPALPRRREDSGHRSMRLDLGPNLHRSGGLAQRPELGG